MLSQMKRTALAIALTGAFSVAFAQTQTDANDSDGTRKFDDRERLTQLLLADDQAELDQELARLDGVEEEARANLKLRSRNWQMLWRPRISKSSASIWSQRTMPLQYRPR